MTFRASQMLGVAFLLALLGPSVWAQGTFNLSSAKGTKPKVLLPDGFTPAAGSNYSVDVAVLNPATAAYETPMKLGAPFTPVSLKTGANAGLFSGGMITVPFVAPGQDATIRIRVWDITTGATYDQATVFGEAVFVVRLGGIIDPGTGIPGLAADIVPAYSGLTLQGRHEPQIYRVELPLRLERVGTDWVLSWPVNETPPVLVPGAPYQFAYQYSFSTNLTSLAKYPDPRPMGALMYYQQIEVWPVRSGDRYSVPLLVTNAPEGYFRVFAYHRYW